MEGLLTQLIAIGAWFIIIDFPDKAAQKKNFISQFDIQLIKDRINKDRGDATPDLPHTWGNLGRHFLDWKLYALCVFFWASWPFEVHIWLTHLIALSCLCPQQCLRKHVKNSSAWFRILTLFCSKLCLFLLLPEHHPRM
jgi:hypothetical protein